MNQHDLDILELGLRVKNEIWSENFGPHRAAATRLAIWRRTRKLPDRRRERRRAVIASIKTPIEFVPDWAGLGFTARNDESTT